MHFAPKSTLAAAFGVLLCCLAAASAPRTETLYLSGHGADDTVPWDFFCSAGRNSGVWTQIPVPSCWETEGFGTYDYGVLLRGTKRLPHQPPPPAATGLYRHAFNVPADWSGRSVRIVFEGVLTDTEVSVNGHPAGPIHQGGFYRFHYDITDLVHPGPDNLLEVTVHNRSANASVNNAERFADYWNFSGIFRPVWLEARPASAALDRVAIDAHADGAFTADVFLAAPAKSPLTLTTRIETLDGRPVGAPASAAIPAGAASATAHLRIDSPDTWSAETPALYRARFTLSTSAGAFHELVQRFGFRTFELRPGDGLYLNGHRITLRGVDRHSFNPGTGRTLSPRLNRDDVALLREANLNAVRMSHYPPDPDFLDLCDEAGLYVLDELGGWQRPYDTPTGKRLIGEMVDRDVNHPSILFWDNGNEGGENAANDDEFALHDPQHRVVLHPWARSFRGMNTSHYREFAETVAYSKGPDVFMPTEFLHGLFDGGGGAGLADFWPYMSEGSHAAGGFIWTWTDEGVVRTDEGGRVDAERDLGPDGIVGPHHEKEGSFYTVRDIFCPVQIPLAALPADFSGTLPVRNRFDFLNLSHVTFEWRLLHFSPPGALLFHRSLLAHGRLSGPDLAARTDGSLTLPLPADWRDADLLQLTAFDSRERELWTWSWRWKSGPAAIGAAFPQNAPATLTETPAELIATAGRNTVRIDRATGLLAGLERDDRPVSLARGPRLVAFRRTARILSPVATAPSRLQNLTTSTENGTVVITATFSGQLHTLRWTLAPDADLRLDYSFEGPGTVDLLGLDFDYPEEKMKSKEWFGAGPYRVWQNRLRGTRLERWQTAYNDPIPGESWSYPEFKGWFAGWDWMSFTTTEGRFSFLNAGGSPFVGVYAPRDGLNNPVLVLPHLGLGVYQVIPAIGTKQSEPSNLGPQGQPQNITGEVKGSFLIRLLDQP